MSDLHDLLVAEVERIQPAPPPAFEALAARARHRRVLRSVAASAAGAAVIAGVIVGAAGTLRGDHDRTSLIPAGPLITRGECAGLSVTATLPGHPGRWPIQQGTQPKPIAMPPDALMWLRARGPCVER